MTRLALLFGGVLLVAAACAPAARRAAHDWLGPTAVTALLAFAIASSSAWQVATAAPGRDHDGPPAAWAIDVEPLIDQAHGAERGTGPGRGRAEQQPPRGGRAGAA